LTLQTAVSSSPGQIRASARALAAAGAEVTLAVRNLDAGHRVAASIMERTGNRDITVEPLELANRKSVQAFVKRWTGPLHILINNAGVMAEPLQRTPEGWEHQFATNHLGHFGLAVGLHGALGGRPFEDRRALVSWTLLLPGRIRRSALRSTALRPLACLRTVKDRLRTFCGGSDSPMGRRRHHRQRRDARRHPN
jgi:NAD(P)-dependent dehydrogenase (short-subunit alcohol dehydrogenase family)